MHREVASHGATEEMPVVAGKAVMRLAPEIGRGIGDDQQAFVVQTLGFRGV